MCRWTRTGAPASPDSVTVEPLQTTSPPPVPAARRRGGFGGAAGGRGGGSRRRGGCGRARRRGAGRPRSPVQPAMARRWLIRSTTACRLAIRASDSASGLARWSAMKLRLFRSAVSSPAQFSPALLMPVLIANAPPAKAAAASPMITLRVRPLVLLRYMHRSSVVGRLPRCSIVVYGGRASRAVQFTTLNILIRAQSDSGACRRSMVAPTSAGHPSAGQQRADDHHDERQRHRPGGRLADQLRRPAGQRRAEHGDQHGAPSRRRRRPGSRRPRPMSVSPRHQMPSTSSGQKLDAATANASPTTRETSMLAT